MNIEVVVALGDTNGGLSVGKKNKLNEAKPTYLEVSNHFFTDSRDLLKRFKLCYYNEEIDFASTRSLRMKCFIDLRMALEAVLKSLEAYFNLKDRTGKRLVNRIERYRHNVPKLVNRVITHVPEKHHSKLRSYGAGMIHLPIHLRYKLDVLDFYRLRKELYYRTVASDAWIEELNKLIVELSEFVNKCLSKHSRTIKGEATWDEFVATRYIKDHASEKKED